MSGKDVSIAKKLNRLMTLMEGFGANGLNNAVGTPDEKEIKDILKDLEKKIEESDRQESKTIVELDKNMSLEDQHNRVMELLESPNIDREKFQSSMNEDRSDYE